MGYKRMEYNVTARVSRHNSDQDEEDDALWNDLVRRIVELLKDPKYKPIDPW